MSKRGGAKASGKPPPEAGSSPGPESAADARPFGREHLLFGGVGLLLGTLLGYTLAFQVHSTHRPGFQQAAPPSAMAPGMGVDGTAAGGRPPFLNADGTIDMDKVPPEIRERMEKAKALLASHKKMLEKDPNNTELLTSIGRFYMGLNMADKALVYYRRAVEADPKSADLRVELGYALMDSGQFDEAIQSDRDALEALPGNPDVLTQMGIVYLRMDRVDDALAKLDEAAAADPHHAMSRFNKAVILLFARRDADGAEKALDEAEKVAPQGTDQIQVMRNAIQHFRETGDLPQMPEP